MATWQTFQVSVQGLRILLQFQIPLIVFGTHLFLQRAGAPLCYCSRSKVFLSGNKVPLEGHSNPVLLQYLKSYNGWIPALETWQPRKVTTGLWLFCQLPSNNNSTVFKNFFVSSPNPQPGFKSPHQPICQEIWRVSLCQARFKCLIETPPLRSLKNVSSSFEYPWNLGQSIWKSDKGSSCFF